MKKILSIFAAAFIAVTSASAFQLGAHTGVSLGSYTKEVNIYGDTNKKMEFGAGFDLFGSIPHFYGSSRAFGLFEFGLMGNGFEVSYNAGYSFKINDMIKLEPFAGLGMNNFFLLGGFLVNLGCGVRIPLGIGDLAFDFRYNPTFGLFGRQTVGIHAGYVFLFGKDKANRR